MKMYFVFWLVSIFAQSFVLLVLYYDWESMNCQSSKRLAIILTVSLGLSFLALWTLPSVYFI